MRQCESSLFIAVDWFLLIMLIILCQNTIYLAQTRADNAIMPAGSRDEQQGQVLEPGKPIERELRGGEVHSYEVTVKAGEYLQAG